MFFEKITSFFSKATSNGMNCYQQFTKIKGTKSWNNGFGGRIAGHGNEKRRSAGFSFYVHYKLNTL